MSTQSITPNPIFSLAHTAQICKVKPQVLRDWVADGFIHPIVRGTRGKGCGHRLSVQQVVGICQAVAYWRSARGCRPNFIKVVVTEFDQWPWPAIEHLLALRRDDWSEEDFYKAIGAAPSDGPLPVDHPDDIATRIAFVKMLLRLRDAILKRQHVTRTRFAMAR
jgi:hypothetical protein